MSVLEVRNLKKSFGKDTVVLKGVDFSLNYRHKTDFGGFDMGMNFNAPLSRTRAARNSG